MEMRGTHQCFVCNRSFRWLTNISQGHMSAFSMDDNETQGEAIATGKVTTSDGAKTLFDIEVKCPHCRNKNRFSS